MLDKPRNGVASFADRETFVVDLLTHLSDTIENVLGREEAEYLVCAVASRMARDVTRDIGHLPVQQQDTREMADHLVCLKHRIGGRFEIERQTEDCIEFRGRGCPFGERVKGRESLCQMTSGVFGRVVADTLGYARVTVVESIARGDPSCKVVVDLKRPEGQDASVDPAATEFFRLPPDLPPDVP